jgi:FMN phosphatase YigB (HAD superfamily)
MRIKGILFDLGDTIMVEESEVKDKSSTTLKADLVHGIDKVLAELKARGYSLALVADTKKGTYRNVLRQHKLYDLFDAFAISDEIGVEKPDPRIFTLALNALGMSPEDYGYVLMIGNNLQRDIRGANLVGLISVWFHWNDRYPINPTEPLEEPAFVIHNAEELLSLVDFVERRGIRDKGGLP